MFPVVSPRAGEVARRYARLDAEGRCIYCLEGARLVGLKICDECRRLRSAARAAKKASGKCTEDSGCDRPAVPGRVRCSLHLEMVRRLRREKIERGECTHCSEMRAIGRTKCARHIAIHNARSHRAEQNPESKISKLIVGARGRAAKRGLPFALALADLLPLPVVCPVLSLRLIYAHRTRAEIANSPSLDRISPEAGYVAGNVRVISFRANTLRSNATASELEAVAADARRIETTRRRASPT